MSLVSPAQVKMLVQSNLADEDLQAIIDRVESEITALIGPPQDDTQSVSMTETLAGGGKSLFVRRPVAAVISIVEDDESLTSDDYRVWSEEGRIERLPGGAYWGTVCVVTYAPVDERPKRTQAIIDLVRLMLERTSYRSESIAQGEYAYTSEGDWDAQRQRIIRRLMFVTAG